MLNFPPAVANSCDEVDRVLLSQDIECFFESILLDQTVPSKIPARWISCDQVLFGEEALGSSVVAGREMNLGEPEGIFVVFCGVSACADV
jgi:hypothetical protein